MIARFKMLNCLVCLPSWPSSSLTDLADYVLLLVSTVFAVVKRPFLVLRVTIPYLVLLLLFAAFVMWNGSVVLGLLLSF